MSYTTTLQPTDCFSYMGLLYVGVSLPLPSPN
jgi:hypothetical protein